MTHIEAARLLYLIVDNEYGRGLEPYDNKAVNLISDAWVILSGCNCEDCDDEDCDSSKHARMCAQSDGTFKGKEK